MSGVATATEEPAHGQGWTQAAKLLASDGAAIDVFGISVALSGDTALIGAFDDDDNGTDSGSAYVFVRGQNGWAEQAKLIASDGAKHDRFGSVLSLSGHTALVGAPSADAGGNDWGAVYVFVRSGDSWTEQTELMLSDPMAHDHFGWSLSLDGDTAVIGVPHRNLEDEHNWGAVYVFVRTEGVWTQQAELRASDGHEFHYFGNAVAVVGDTLLVGVSSDEAHGPVSGAAYVFVRRGNGTWIQQAKLVPKDGAAWEAFGSSVSLARDVALVGAFHDDDNGTYSGSAYVFGRSGNRWIQQAKLLPSDGGAGDLFGFSLSLSEDTAFIGAYGDDDAAGDSGAAYVFRSRDDGWIEETKLVAGDGAGEEHFGRSVSLSKSTALIGAPRDDDLAPFSGSAYVFDAALFADGFESGDTSAWSDTVP